MSAFGNKYLGGLERRKAERDQMQADMDALAVQRPTLQLVRDARGFVPVTVKHRRQVDGAPARSVYKGGRA